MRKMVGGWMGGVRNSMLRTGDRLPAWQAAGMATRAGAGAGAAWPCLGAAAEGGGPLQPLQLHARLKDVVGRLQPDAGEDT